MGAALTSNPLRIFPRYTINGELYGDDGCGCALVDVGMLELVESLDGGVAGNFNLEFNVLDRGERKKRGWQKSKGRNRWGSMVFVSRRLKPSALLDKHNEFDVHGTEEYEQA